MKVILKRRKETAANEAMFRITCCRKGWRGCSLNPIKLFPCVSGFADQQSTALDYKQFSTFQKKKKSGDQRRLYLFFSCFCEYLSQLFQDCFAQNSVQQYPQSEIFLGFFLIQFFLKNEDATNVFWLGWHHGLWSFSLTFFSTFQSSLVYSFFLLSISNSNILFRVQCN